MSMIIIGDLHVGSHYFQRDRFLRFLDRLPPGPDLVLNGDTIHHPDDFPPLSGDDERVLDALRNQASKRRVVWMIGNHDRFYTVPNQGGIEFRSFLVDEATRLHISHGWEFLPFYRLSRLVALALRPVRIAFEEETPLSPRLAKRMPLLYGWLNRGTMRNAVRFAGKNGYRAIVCGHTHSPMDTTENGIRYLNHGTWTEWPAFYVWIDGPELSLKQVDDDR